MQLISFSFHVHSGSLSSWFVVIFFILLHWHICKTSAVIEKARVKYAQGCKVDKVDYLLMILHHFPPKHAFWGDTRSGQTLVQLKYKWHKMTTEPKVFLVWMKKLQHFCITCLLFEKTKKTQTYKKKPTELTQYRNSLYICVALCMISLCHQ